RQLRLIGLRHVKVKVGTGDDVERVRIVRETMGPAVTIRVDANGAWSFDQAVATIRDIACFGVAAVEQPIPRSTPADFPMLRRQVSVPLMADESMVTEEDAQQLIEAKAVDYLNIRVSKCGGISRSARIARLAARAGIRVQVGSQVGETAILSAAGRHLAAAFEQVDFAEGSFGTMLLTEDVSRDSIRFGFGGSAPVLRGPGLGIRISENALNKYSTQVIKLN